MKPIADTHTAAIQAAQHFTGQLGPTNRRCDPAQWETEINGEPKFLALELVTKPNLKTEEAAHYLNRRPQTLRAWACLENGPIRPRRVGGLLAWSTAEIKALAGVSQ